MNRITTFCNVLLLMLVLSACNKQAGLNNSQTTLETGLTAAGNSGLLIATGAQAKNIRDAYIVVLRDDINNIDAEIQTMCSGMGGAKADHVYRNAIKGFSVRVPAAAIRGLLNNPRIKYIEQDQEVQATNTQTGATWGLDRTDQRNLPLNSTYTYNSNGATVDSYIFDTGIRTDHVEFTGRRVSGYDAFGGTANDLNGHGTHVAGTVGGTTYGIAKGTRLIAVKVLGDNGSGTLSGVIAGVDWAVGHHVAGKPAVGNMSLGSGASQSVDDAVRRAIADGIIMVVAAGNNNANASNYSPARTVEAITVGSTTNTDARSSFSNFGAVLDIFAPGSAITSAWHTSSTAINTISGTSMASPHVAGVAALYLEANPGSTQAQVKQGLKASATPNVVTSAGTGSPNLLLFSGSFVVVPPTPPATPLLVSPANAATNVSASNATVSWSAAAGATSYRVELLNSPTDITPLQSRTGITGTSVSFNGLNGTTTYHWRVTAVNTVGTAVSQTRSFTTAALAVPVLTSPANGATRISRTPTLRWNTTGTLAYDIQVSTNSNFTSPLQFSSTTTSVVVSQTLLSRTRYFWRVRSKNNASTGAWSAAWSFTTQ